MFIDVSQQSYTNSVRKINMDGTKRNTIMTFGPGSYLAGASFDFELESYAHVLVGNYCSLAHRLVFEIGANHNYRSVSTYPFFVKTSPRISPVLREPNSYNKYQIIIGNDVWIGCDVTIMSGVKIGNGAVIGAGTVVAKDVPPYAIVVGNPGRVIKYRFEEEIIEKLQKIKWWYWDEEKILQESSLMENPKAFIAKHLPKGYNNTKASDFDEDIIKLANEGYIVYNYIMDFESEGQLWPRVIEQFANKFTPQDKVLLIIGIETNGVANITRLAEYVEALNKEMPLILAYDAKYKVESLKYANYFITNREAASTICVDYSDDFGVEVLSGFADNIYK